MKKIVKQISLFFLMIIGFITLASCNGPIIDLNKKEIENVVFKDAEYVYDGNPHSITIEGELPEGATVRYENNEHTDAGIYNVKSTITCEGYKSLVLNATLTIARKPIEDIYFRNQTFTYDGTPKSLELIGDLPRGVFVRFYGNNKTRAGRYIVRASLRDTTGNYLLPGDMLAFMTIEKADFDMSKVGFNGKTVVYDGKEHSLSISGTLPNGVSVSYENNKLTNAGTTHAIARFKHSNPNYNQIEPMEADLTVVKKVLTGISFSNRTYVYNGNPHSLMIRGLLPKGVTVEYINNKQTEVGKYEVTANFKDTTGNYFEPESMTAYLTISKARFNMSGVSFNDAIYTYDGKEHSLMINGQLPEGVSVEYENNSLTNVGSNKVIAKFVHNNPNYYDIDQMTANLTIIKSDVSGISFSDKTYVYDGKEHSLMINGQLPEGVYAVYKNNNHTNVGTHKVTVTFVDTTGNYNLPNELVANLIIEKAEFDMSGITFEDESYIFDGNNHKLEIRGKLPTEVKVTYTNNEHTNVGVYKATAIFTHNNPNYKEINSMFATLRIVERQIENISFNDKTFTYDGKPHSIAITGQLPTGVSVEYSANGFIDAGNYLITAIFKDSTGNYKDLPQMQAYLIIKRADYDMSGIKFDSETYTYDEKEHELLIKGTLPKGVTVKYIDNKLTQVGSIKAIAKFTHNNRNYNSIKDMSANLTITKSNIGNIKFNGQTVTYDGEIKSLEIEGTLPKGVTVKYINNNQKNVGVYTVIAKFSDSTGNYKLPNDMTATLTINKADFDMSGITFEDEIHTFDGEEHELLIKGNLPEGVSVRYVDNKRKNVGVSHALAIFSHNNPNYNEINSLSADLTISEKVIEGISFKGQTFTYDGIAKSIFISGELPTGVTVKYTNNGKTDAGTYEVVATFTDSTGNYGELTPMTATLVITKANYDMSGIKFDSETHTYDTYEHELLISGKLPEGVEVSYVNNKLTNAGSIKATAKFSHNDKNYNPIKDMTATLVITKADIKGITLNGDEVVYDNKPHSLEINGTLPKGVEVNYTNNNKTDAGTYHVTATFIDTTGNYNVPNNLHADLVITKANYDMSDVKFESQSFVYDGSTHKLEISGELPKGVSVRYENNTLKDVGEKTAKAIFTHNNKNYNEINSMTAILKVTNSSIEGISFKGQTFQYDGNPHSIAITGTLPDGVIVHYENNGKTDAGTYEVVATFIDTTGNYNDLEPLTAKLVITKANYDMSGIKFDSETHTYDTYEHELLIKGKLPDDVEVSYVNNKLTNVGETKATAKFSHNDKNYNPIKDMTATLVITKADIKGITLNGDEVVYDNKPHSLEINGTLPKGVEVNYTNNNKTDAGTYHVTASFIDTTGNYNVPNDLTADLVIDKADFDMSEVTFATKTYTFDNQEHELIITGNLPDGVTVSYSNNKRRDVGVSHALAIFNHANPNYNEIASMSADLIITEKAIEGITFESKKFVYDGKPHSIAITGTLPDGVTVRYENNRKTDAGRYDVTAIFTDKTGNYSDLHSLQAQLIIDKATYDMSGVKFENAHHTYDNVKHTLEISGNLPTGVEVSYTPNTLINVGEIKVTASFKGDSKNYYPIEDKVASLIISKADIKGITLNGDEVVYDNKPHSLEINGTLPKGVEVNYTNNNKTDAGTYHVTATFTDTTGNYNVPNPLKADLVILKADFDMSGITFEPETHTYDGQKHELLIGGKLPVDVNPVYEENTRTNAGVSHALVKFVHNNPNYNEINSMQADLTITKKVIDGISLSGKEVVYDTHSHSLVINGQLPAGVKPIYKGNGVTDAGKYTVSVTFIDKNQYKNYVLPEEMSAILNIKRADFDMSTVSFEDKTVEYNGETQSLKVTGDLPNGVTAKYINNDQVNAGKYEVTAKFSHDNPNYNPIKDINAFLIINKKMISNISFIDKEVVYNCFDYDISIKGILPDGVEPKYTPKNIYKDAGTYPVNVTFIDTNINKNYILPEEMSATLTIKQADFNMSEVKFDSKSEVYDGEMHTITITGELPSGVTVAYENNTLTEVGSVDAIAKFSHNNKNYKEIPDMHATLTITNSSIKGVSFSGKTVTYDEKPHSLVISGELPKGITVSYDKENLVDADTYVITAVFTYITSGEILDTMKATLVINKANYNMSGIEFRDQSFVYDEKPHSLAISGELPEGVTVSYSDNNSLTNVNSVKVIAKFSHNNKNYNEIPSMSANLTITKKNISGITIKGDTVVYDEKPHSLAISGELPKGVTVSYRNNDKVNVGVYEVVATFKDSTGNYNVPNPISAELVIEQAEFDMSKVKFESQSFVYDGKSHSLAISGELPNGVTVSYSENNSLTNVGSENILAIFSHNNPNYKQIDSILAVLSVTKKTIENITFNGDTVTYDGEIHKLQISGTLPDGVNSIYENNDNKVAGKHTVTVTFDDTTGNYNVPEEMTATLTIEKAAVDMSGVEFKGASYVYDGTEHKLVINEKILPEGVSVTYEKNTLTNVGKTIAVANFTYKDSENYELIPSQKATLEITPKEIKGVTFENKTETYNGTIHRLELGGTPLPEGVVPQFSDEGHRDAGEYPVTVTFVDTNEHKNYILPQSMTATLTIEQADFDMSGVKFNDETHVYDGKEHELLIKGKLPEGVEVSYINNKRTNVGISHAEAIFTHSNPNYKEISSMKADLIINKQVIEGITFSDKHVVYNKHMHKIEISGTLPSGVTVSYTPKNEYTNAGTYKVTANFTDTTGNYGKLDSMTATLTIEKAVIDMSGVKFNSETHVYDGQEHELIITDQLPEGVSVTYEKNTLTNVGTTKAIAKFTYVDTNNYYAIKDMSANLTITKATLKGVTLEDMNETYNGSSYTLKVTGKIPAGLKVEYSNNVQTNAGSYPVTAHFVDEFNNYNPIKDMHATLNIAKAHVDIDNSWFTDKTVTYNEQLHKVEVTKPLPEGVVRVEYNNNEHTNANEAGYNAKVTFIYDDNHEGLYKLDAKLIIKRKQITGITFEDNTVTYDTNSHSLAIKGDLPIGVEAKYVGNDQVKAGKHIVKVNFVDTNEHKNYILPNSMTATLTIEKAVIDMSGVKFNSKTYVYDGREHELIITDQLPEGVSVTYEKNKLTNVGKTTAKANFTYKDSENYELIPSKEATLEITKATLSGVSFNNKVVTYNKNPYTIAISGQVPAGLRVEYLQENTYTDAGDYKVTAHFVDEFNNYNPIEDMTATLTIEQADFDMSGVKVVNNVHTYDGHAHSLEVIGLPSGVTVDYIEGEQAIDAKTYDVTIHFANSDGNYNTPAPMAAQIIIKPIELKFSLQNKEYLYDGEYHELTLEGDYLPSSVHVEYINNKHKEAGKHPVKVLFTYDKNHIGPDKLEATLTILRPLHNVTFRQVKDGLTIAPDITRQVLHLDNVTDIPELTPVDGFLASWEDIDLTNIKQDIIVNAIYEPIVSRIEYYVNGVLVKQEESKYLDYFTVSSFKLDDNLSLNKWIFDGKVFEANKKYQYTYKTTIKLVNNDVNLINGSASDFDFKLNGIQKTATLIKYNGNATDVIIPDYILMNDEVYKLTIIGTESFMSCNTIETISISNNIVAIEDSAFQYSSLLQVVIPDSVLTIGNYAFSDNMNLEKVTLPSGLKELSEGVFYYCPNLIECLIPEGLTTIRTLAFADSESLEEFVLPESIEIVEENALLTGDNIIFIPLEKDNGKIPGVVKNDIFTSNIIWNYAGERGITDYYKWALLKDQTVTLYKYIGREKDLIIPDTINGKIVNKISMRTFMENDVVETIVISKNIEYISDLAFVNANQYLTIFTYQSSKLPGWDDDWNKNKKVIWNYGGKNGKINGIKWYLEKNNTITIYDYNKLNLGINDNLIIPNEIEGYKVKKIADFAFKHNAHRKIILSDGITTIGKGAFETTTLDSIYIPSSVTTIGDGAIFSSEKDGGVIFIDFDTIPWKNSWYNKFFDQTTGMENEREIYFKGEFTTDENGTYYPIR